MVAWISLKELCHIEEVRKPILVLPFYIADQVLGYLQQDRRRIENEAFSGNLLGIIATNALELGVDIGVLDAVIMLGFPVGIANFVSLNLLP